MSTLLLREKLIAIAAHEVGTMEIPRNSNSGPRVKEYQRATNLEGTGWPYCAAFVDWCIREWLKNSDVLAALGIKGPHEAEEWRPKTAAAFGLIDWGEKHHMLIMDDNPSHVLHTADIVVFDFSHTGILVDDFEKDGVSWIKTIDGNTSPESGNNEGGGVYVRTRKRSTAKRFIRMLA